MPNKLRVGLVGHGKAGQAVANVLSNDPRFELRWIARRSVAGQPYTHSGTDIPVVGIEQHPFPELFESMPVDMPAAEARSAIERSRSRRTARIWVPSAFSRLRSGLPGAAEPVKVS